MLASFLPRASWSARRRQRRGPRLFLLLCLTLLTLAAAGLVRAQDTEAGNPTGPSGDFNGEVTTGGAYDPLTGNLKRRVTDLTVPGSNGAYPLAFARTYNSQVYLAGNDHAVLGDGSNWRHSYQWNLEITATNTINGTVTAYTVSYPDGAAITFRPNREAAPSAEFASYWRGPSGTADRLEVFSTNNVVLHTSDGGLVTFQNSAWPQTLTDPNGAITKLDYSPAGSGFLSQVTEPGGRFLTFAYTTYTQSYTDVNNHPRTWSATLLTGVSASTGQSVDLTYTQYDPNHTVNLTAGDSPSSRAGTVNYLVLTDVNYHVEDSGHADVHAGYGYSFSNGNPPYLWYATDPHYAGAMKQIRYAGNDLYNGTSFEEQNLNNSQRVSHLERSTSYDSTNKATRTTSTETRGDLAASNSAAIQRTFQYGPAVIIPGDPTQPKASLLTSLVDFEGNTTSYSYYVKADKDTNGKSFLHAVTTPGGTTTYEHEPLTGKVTKVILPDGRQRTSVWSNRDRSDGRLPYYLWESTDERGQTTRYTRYANKGGLVQSITSPDGGVESFDYLSFNSPNGGVYWKVSQHTTKLGAVITYTYGNNGGSGRGDLLVSVTRQYNDVPVRNGTPAAHTETTNFHYDALDRVDQTWDPRNVSDQFAYNARHQVTRVLHVADNTHVDTAYDDWGRALSVTDELGHTTSTVPDEYGRPTSVTVPVNAGGVSTRTVQATYDRRTTSNGVVGSALSHTSGAFSYQMLPSGRATQRMYTNNGWLSDEYVGQSNGDINNPYFPSCLRTRHIDTYDYAGRVLRSTDANGQPWFQHYDACGRPDSATDPLGHTATTSYYPWNHAYAGLVQSVTAPGNNVSATLTTSYTAYDAMGRSTSLTDPQNHAFDSDYNAAGSLKSQTDGRDAGSATNPHLATGYKYDGLGRKGRIDYADGTSERWTYDASGNVATYQNRAGALRTSQYNDGRNRCTGYAWSNEPAGVQTSGGTYTYRANGLLKEASNAVSNIRYAYDDSNALVSEDELTAQPTRRVTQYTHDADGRVDKIIYPNGNPPHFTCDAQGRPSGLDAFGTQFSLYFYSGDRLASRYLLNGFSTTYDYQNNGRVWDVWHHNPNGHNVRRQCYGYYPNGQLSWADREGDGTGSDGSVPANSIASGSILENGRGDVFRYYGDGSLYYGARDIAASGGWPGAYSATADGSVTDANVSYAGASASTYGFSYYYDAAGNRTQANQMGQATIPYGADGENRYGGSAYDGNANTTNSAVGWTYAFDSENRLVSAAGPGGQTLGFAYDAADRLVMQVTNGVPAFFYYAGAQRIEERDANNNLVYLYFYEAPGSDRLLWREGGPWGRLWYQTDAFGNTTHLSAEQYDAQGHIVGGYVVEQYLYDAYGTPTVYDAAGRVRPGGSAFDNRSLYRSGGGYQWLPQAGLDFCRARFYLPQHGRWLQPDPIGQAGGLNLYAYCHNDPINQSDPSGLRSPHPEVPIESNDITPDDPRDAPDHQNLDYTPTGSHIPASVRFSYNPQGWGVILQVPGQGATVLYQSSPSFTSVGGLSMVSPSETGAYSNHKIDVMGTGADYYKALDHANDTGNDTAYSGRGFFGDLIMDVYSKLFGGYNNQDAMDLAAYARPYNGNVTITGYSEGTANMVEAASEYGMRASTMNFVAPAVSIWGAVAASKAAGAKLGEYNQKWFDVSNVYAPSANPLKFLSGIVPVYNIMVHTSSYPPFTKGGG